MKVQLARIVRSAAVVAAATALALTGCGPGHGSAAGKVTYQGKPLVFGSVVFVGGDNRPVNAAIATDGTYTAPSLLEGPNHIMVYSPDPASVGPIDKLGNQKEAPPVDPKLWFPIPDKYTDVDKSGLECAIQRNTTNPVNLELK